MLRLSYILLLLLGCFYYHLHVARGGRAARRVGVELGPEGNTTFLDGTTWCVASAGVRQSELQIALDWACGIGAADCEKLRPGRECFQPNNLLSHASYAFNSFYQQNGNSDIACNFGGTAAITTLNPSYGSCTLSNFRARYLVFSCSLCCNNSTVYIWVFAAAAAAALLMTLCMIV